MRHANTWHIIGRGFNGWHAKGTHSWGDGHGGEVSSSGGGLDEFLPEAMPGALVYDAEHLRDVPAGDVFAQLVIKGPMLDVKLAPWQHRDFIGDTTRTLPEGSPVTAAEFRSLDSVGLGVMRALYAQVPGIFLGTVTAEGRVEWSRRGVDLDECHCPIGEWYSEQCPACRMNGGAK